jgi:hypothetical protein
MKSNKIYLTFFLMILLSGGVLAATDWPVCIDLIKPSAPAGLQATGNLQLGWNAVIDKPDCSGIAYYNIYKNGLLIKTSTTTTYSESALADGTYTFAVSAVDKAKNEGEKATISVTFPISSPPVVNPPAGNGGGGPSSSGGGGGGPSNIVTQTSVTGGTCTENWQCDGWSNVNEQCGTRTCTDANSCGTTVNKPATEQACAETVQTRDFLGLTGAAIGSFVRSGTGITTIVILVAIIAGSMVFFGVKRGKLAKKRKGK